MLSAYFGYAATIISVTVFLPQAVKAWRTKHTKDLAMATYVLTAMATSTWLVYGLLIKDAPIIMTNTVNTTVSLFIIGLKLRHG